MSAYVVSTTHIDALVAAGLKFSEPGYPLRWMDRRPTAEECSAVYTPGEAIPAGSMVWYQDHVRKLTTTTAGRVGAMLLAENVRSVNHRYDETEWEEPYTFEALPGQPDPLTVLRAISGYEYQSCEHPEWETSEAHAYIRALEQAAIGALPGYRESEGRDIDDRNIWKANVR